MKQYESYKDSGVQWIGEIPSHWKYVKVSWVFPNIGSGTTPDTNNANYYAEEGINWLQTGDLNDGDIVETSKHITELALQERGLRIFPKGSLVIAMYGATIGKVGLLQIETTTNQACCVLPPSENMSISYTKYVLQSAKEVLLQQSIGGGQPNISQAIIKALNIPYPSLEEQRVIAAYLDHKVGQIDAIIAEKEAMVSDLTVYRSAVISEAVTRGLDKSAPMRDSGIDWIGQIPEHWQVVKLKYTGSFGNGLTYSPNEVVDDGILVLRSSNIQNSNLAYEDCVYVKDAPNELKVCPGDIIICSRNGSASLVGKCAYVKQIENATFGAFMMRYRPSIHAKFAFYAFQTATASYKGLYSTSTINQITKAVIDQMFIVIPTLEEQLRIAEYLDNKTSFVDESIAELQAEITDLQSYKSAIITEAVTGKVDLRDWKPKTVTA